MKLTSQLLLKMLKVTVPVQYGLPAIQEKKDPKGKSSPGDLHPSHSFKLSNRHTIELYTRSLLSYTIQQSSHRSCETLKGYIEEEEEEK